MASPTLDPYRLAELLSDLVGQLRIANPADDPNHPVEQDVAQVVALQAALPDLPDLLEDRALLDRLDETREPIASSDGTTLLAYAWGVQGQHLAVRDALRDLPRAAVSSGGIAGTETPTENDDAQF